ncbi:MAG: hypothetical protein RL040_565 [Bacteroidota bacterium]
MKKFAAFILTFVSFTALGSSLEETEQKLSYLHTQLASSEDDTRGDSICEAMRQTWIESFNQPEVFDYPFKRLKFCTLVSKDHHIRLLNWNLPYRDGTYKYFCFLLVWDDEKKNFTWVELQDSMHEPEKLESRFLTAEKWLGALYFEIIPMTKKGKSTTYTLLGWDGRDNLTSRKVIDALTITGEKIRLGANLFEYQGDTRKRVIFEYSNEVSASMRHYPKKKCIVMDHLSPKSPMMQGIYADYGPDGTYCMFMLKKDKWVFMDEIDISQFADDDSKPYRDPRKK